VEVDTIVQSMTDDKVEHPVTAIVAAEFLSLHPKTVVRMARTCELPAHPIGQGRRLRWLFYLAELDAWLKARVISNCHPCRELNGDLQ
jgi:excisionase family DNA binding protein